MQHLKDTHKHHTKQHRRCWICTKQHPTPCSTWKIHTHHTTQHLTTDFENDPAASFTGEHACKSPVAPKPWRYARAYTHANTHAHTHPCAHAHTHTHTHTHTRTHTRAHTQFTCASAKGKRTHPCLLGSAKWFLLTYCSMACERYMHLIYYDI